MKRRELLIAGGASLFPGSWTQGLAAARASAAHKRKALLSNYLRYQPVNNGMWHIPDPGVTISTLFNLEAQPLFLRLLYHNETDQPVPIDGAAVAMTSAVGDALNPADANGAMAMELWRKVTFEEKGRDVALDTSNIQRRDVTSLAQPPAIGGDKQRPSIAYSDWMAMPELAPRDGSFGALVLVRTFSNQFVRLQSSHGVGPGIPRAMSTFFGRKGDDSTRPPWVFQSPREAPCHAPLAVEYYTSARGATVAGIGDSIMNGFRTGFDSAFVYRACVAVSRPERPVSFVNEAYGGRRSDEYLSNAKALLQSMMPPQFVVIQAWSENDPHTQAAADLALDGALELAALARGKGIIPILTTAAPVYARDPKSDVFRIESNIRVRQLEPIGYDVIDLDVLWGTGVTPNAYAADYDFGDHTHPTDAAEIVAAAAAAKILKKYLG